MELGWWVEGKHLVVAVGQGAIEQAIAVADGTAANVTTNPLWAKYSQPQAGELTSFGWLNLAPLRAMFGGMPVPTNNPDKPTSVQELLIATGLDNLNSVGMQAGIQGRSLTSVTMLDAPGERRGLLSLIDQAPISIADLPPLPQQMSGLFVASFDAAGAVETLYTVAADLEAILSPDTTNVQSGRSMAKDHLGLDLIDDFLAALGNVHTVYSDEAQATIGLAPILVSQVKDSEKLNTALNRLLVELLPQVSQGAARANVTEKDGIKSYSVEIPQAGMSPMISVGTNGCAFLRCPSLWWRSTCGKPVNFRLGLWIRCMKRPVPLFPRASPACRSSIHVRPTSCFSDWPRLESAWPRSVWLNPACSRPARPVRSSCRTCRPLNSSHGICIRTSAGRS